ncbi:DUF421 domain-containing protein [Virgibacillus proomii]|nr:DUF421 domain-containing protein [Virgibacillus proomii]
MSVLAKEDSIPATPKMLDQQVKYKGLPIAVVT